MVKSYNNLSILACCAVIIIQQNDVIAMVLEAPLRSSSPPITHAPSTNNIPTTTTVPSKHNKRFRIRHTHIDDISAISTMLAMESICIGASSTTTLNWNQTMQLLRAKAIFDKQLSYRLAAIEEGRETARQLRDHGVHIDMYSLWTNDNFRDKVQLAARNAQEENTNTWRSHNFDMLPPTSSMLNHVMVSVIDCGNDDIVGFCEVAMLKTLQQTGNDIQLQQRIQVSDNSLDIQLPSTTTDSDSYCDMPQQDTYDMNNHYHQQQAHQTFCCAPAIVNLVTSSQHRRMGVASRILSFAMRYTSTQWQRKQSMVDNNNNSMMMKNLGLYVHPENISALALYEKKGFVFVDSNAEDSLLYLSHK